MRLRSNGSDRHFWSFLAMYIRQSQVGQFNEDFSFQHWFWPVIVSVCHCSGFEWTSSGGVPSTTCPEVGWGALTAVCSVILALVKEFRSSLAEVVQSQSRSGSFLVMWACRVLLICGDCQQAGDSDNVGGQWSKAHIWHATLTVRTHTFVWTQKRIDFSWTLVEIVSPCDFPLVNAVTCSGKWTNKLQWNLQKPFSRESWFSNKIK
jgi:hypothetical protein